MVDQATVGKAAPRANGRQSFPPRAVARNMADVGHDVTVLAELQLQLLSADCREATRRLTLPTGLAAVASILAVCALPILFVALALGINALLEWPAWAGFLLTSGVFLLLSVILLGVAYAGFRRSMKPLDRSREEFNQNIRWLKDVLRNMGTRGTPRC